MMVISKRYSRRRQRRLRSKSEPLPIVVPAVPGVVRDSDTTARRIFADALGDYDETTPFAKLVS
jgi:hypothetical protein